MAQEAAGSAAESLPQTMPIGSTANTSNLIGGAVSTMGQGLPGGISHMIDLANATSSPLTEAAGDTSGMTGGSDSTTVTPDPAEAQNAAGESDAIPFHVDMSTTITVTEGERFFHFPKDAYASADTDMTQPATINPSHGHIGPLPLTSGTIIWSALGLLLTLSLTAYYTSTRQAWQARA